MELDACECPFFDSIHYIIIVFRRGTMQRATDIFTSIFYVYARRAPPMPYAIGATVHYVWRVAVVLWRRILHSIFVHALLL